VNGFNRLVHAARSVVAPRQLTDSATCGTVGAALETASGEVFAGVCVDTASSLGFCAEHAAAAAMLTAGQSIVVRMVAVNRHGAVLPPCGRCREFISQLDVANGDTLVMVDASTTIALRDLLPFRS
jgi:cytidine deaminase